MESFSKYSFFNFFNTTFLLSSPNVEKVGGGLNISVSEKKEISALDLALGYVPAGESTEQYKVRIEQCVKAQCGKKRKNELMDLPTWSSAWTFTCSCGPVYYSGPLYRDYTTGMRTQSPICRHIGAALIVHFH